MTNNNNNNNDTNSKICLALVLFSLCMLNQRCIHINLSLLLLEQGTL